MATFSVWAPHARSVAVRAGGSDHPMKADGAWWHAEVSGIGPGSDYFFVVDGGKPVPDPRSAFQPEGIHGPSRLVDHSLFQWTDHGWQPGPFGAAIVYELHIGTFTAGGTFESAVERLDYLAGLGVTHVELMPVNEFSGAWGWGYDGVDLYAPHHAYGGPQGLKRFVDACHARGLAAILDVVYNHLGPSGNYLAMFGPYFTGRHSTPWGEAVNLDGPESDEVRRFLIDNALMWLRDYDFDGLRLDAVHALVDTSAVHFLEQLTDEVRRLEDITGRRKVLIAESDLNDPHIVRSREAGGYGLDAQWSDDFHHALHSVLAGETSGYYEDFGKIRDIAKALEQTFVYAGHFSVHRRRKHGRPASDVSSHRFLGYSQTHDQVGNRARGERLCHLAGVRRAKIGAALTLTSPFVPMLFQGEEFAASTPFQYFTQHNEEQLAKAVLEGRRREFAGFGWRPEDVPDPQDPQTFQRSKLNWDEIGTGEHQEMLDWYRDLIRLRRGQPALAAGRNSTFAVEYSETEKWLSMQRGEVGVACNFGTRIASIPARGVRSILLSSEGGMKIVGDAVIAPPNSVIVHLNS